MIYKKGLLMARLTENLDFAELEEAIKDTGLCFGMMEKEYDTIALYVRTQRSKHALWQGSVWYMYSNDLVILYATGTKNISLSIWTLEGLLMEIGTQLDNYVCKS